MSTTQSSHNVTKRQPPDHPTVFSQTEVAAKTGMTAAESRHLLKNLIDGLSDDELSKFQGGRVTVVL